MSKQKKIPGHKYSEKIRARVWIEGADEHWLGVGKVALLQAIDETGSMNKAAKNLGMSYKRAWGLVDEMNKLTSEPLVVKEIGGTGGGGTMLTETGRVAIESYQQLEYELGEFLKEKSKQIDWL